MAYGGIIGQDGGAISPSVLAQYGLSSGNASDVLGMLKGSLKVGQSQVQTAQIGTDWSSINSIEDLNYVTSVIYAFDKWYVFGAGQSYCYTTTDWKSFNKIELPSIIEVDSYIYQNGVLSIAYGSGQSIFYTTDGASFSQKYISSFPAGKWSMAYGNGIWVVKITQRNNSYSTEQSVLISHTGMDDWEIKNTTYSIPRASGIAFGNGKFIIVQNNINNASQNAYYYTSSDGEDWEMLTFPSEYNGGYWDGGVIYTGTVFVAAGSFIAYSKDGRSWTKSPYAGSTVRRIAYGAGIIVVDCNNSVNSELMNNSIQYSTDLNTWNKASNFSTASQGFGSYCLLTYGNGAFFACGRQPQLYISQNVYKTQYTLQTPTGIDITGEVAQALGSIKVETGSYTGIETYGASNPNSLTFSGPPILVWFFATKNANSSNGPWDTPDLSFDGHSALCTVPMWALGTDFAVGPPYIAFGTGSSGNQSGYSKKSPDGKTLSWYNTEAPVYQLNSNVYEYFYIAFIPAGGDT